MPVVNQTRNMMGCNHKRPLIQRLDKFHGKKNIFWWQAGTATFVIFFGARNQYHTMTALLSFHIQIFFSFPHIQLLYDF